MEPRSCGYLHFIAVSRGGEVIKVLNTSRVKKVPKFKSVEEIYGSNGRPPKVSRSLAIPDGCDEVMRAVKIEATEEGEPDFDAMTLKQFAKTCKSKKRKVFPSVNLMEVKQEHTCSAHQENASDLTETLGSWKRKLFKKRKAKKGITKSNTLEGKSDAPLHDQIRIKVEDIELDCLEPQPISCMLPDNTRNDTGEILVASEYCSDGNIRTTPSGFQSTLQNVTHHEQFQRPLSSFPEARFGCLGEPSHELSESDDPVIPVVCWDSEIEHVEKDHDTDTVVTDQHLDSPEEEPRKEEGPTDVIMGNEAAVLAENCAVNTVSYEHPLISEDSKTEEAIKLNGEPASSNNSIRSPVSNLTCEEEMSTQMTHDEAPVLAENSIPNQTSYEHLEPSPLQNPLISEDSKFEETIEFSVEAVSSDKSLASPVLELRHEEGTSVPMTCNEAPETMFSECDRSDHQDSLPNDDSVFVQVPCTGPDTICQKVESKDDEKAFGTQDESKDMDSDVIRSEAVQQGSCVKSTTCLPSANGVASKGNAGLPVEEIQSSSMHNITATHLNRLRDIQPCGFMDQMFRGSSASESCARNVPHPPERLFSARKTISPNSQERLCRVMNSVEAQEKVDIHSCKEKLPFEQYYKDKSSSSNSGVRRSRIVFTSRRLEAVSNNIRQSLRKGKDERKGLHCKDVAKGPNGSQNAVSGRGSPVQSRPQSAIQFSQRQMSDIERIAQRLMAQVQSMKDIFVDALQYESRPGAKLRYNTDQVREAVENATKAEESTKRFLTMMTRDCNRFCKIMRLAEDYGVPLKLAEDDTGSPEKAGQKGRKITFADEAGGSLCDVRLFETATAEACNGVEFQVKEESLGA